MIGQRGDTDTMIRFGPFEVNLDAGELRKHGSKIKLADQPFSILALLLAQPGRVVTREELQKTLWADDTFVDFDRGLNKAVNRLRDALGDSAEAPRYIETLPKRGYRFIGVVAAPTAAGPETTSPPPPEQAELHPGHAAPARRRWRWLAWGAGALLALSGVTIYYWRSDRAGSNPDQPIVRASVLPPANASFVPYNFALSPDGRQLVFVAADQSGARSLWLRAVSAIEPRPLKGTDQASLPFWAPDAQRVGFFADRKLKTMDIASGAVHVIADARRPSGGTWNHDGTIVFAPDVNGPLYRVPESGGTPTALTIVSAPDDGEGHRWPVFLPDGRHVLYVAEGRGLTTNGIFVVALSSGKQAQISSQPVRGVAFALDHLFFAAGPTLKAQPFDAVRLQTTGDPLSLAERDVALAPAFFPSGFSISQTGILAFQSASDLATRLTWFDTNGKELGHVSDEAFSDPSLSPDGRLVAASCDPFRNGHLAICTYDLARGIAARVTAGSSDRFPVWSPDGREIAYLSNGDMYRIAADGSAPARLVTTRGIPTTWSRDGRILLFGSRNAMVGLAVSSADGATTNLGPGSEGQLSPDASWIVHNSPDGIVARRFPPRGPQVQIAGYGGHQPRWSRDGRQIFYVTVDKKLMAVDFDPARGIAGAPRVLFQTRIVGSEFSGFQYDVADDGRFLVNAFVSTAPPLTLVTGWTTALRR